MTILEALNWGESELKSTQKDKIHAIHNPKLDTQVLLSAALQKPTSYLISHINDPLQIRISDQFISFIEKRKQHMPVAYILGKQEFFGRKFFVNKHTLIPRPETETLIEIVQELAQPRSVFFDIGTGSGAIAITLAAELQTQVIATDISRDALSVAEKNAGSLHVGHLIAFKQGDLLSPFLDLHINLSREPHAVIVANLPYLPESDWSELDPDVKNYEPKTALTSGDDGLSHYRRLLQQISENQNLFPKHIDLLLEIDPRQKRILQQMISEYFSNSPVQFLYDLSGKIRFCKMRLHGLTAVVS